MHPSSNELSPTLDVLIIGAGLSGVGAARHLQMLCPTKRWAMVDARQAIGGTWDLFRYPGVRSDSDMHTLGYSFKPWKARKAIADGPAILSYVQEVAQEAGVAQRLRLGERVVAADWRSEEALWQVRLSRVSDGSESVLRVRFLYFCSGYYSYTEAYQPSFEGQADFAGPIIHPQFWPKSLDYSGKRVVVIGSGATAVTLVPEMAKTASHVVMLQRSPSYVISRPAEDKIALALARVLPSTWAYGLTRWKNVLLGVYFYGVSKRSPEAVKKYLLGLVSKELGGKAELTQHFSPRYAPWDQRVCAVPDSDLFHQINAGRASVVTDTIERFTSTGIKLASGQEIAADIIITATGLKLNVLGDIALSKDGIPFVAHEAMAYKGMMLSDLPNAAMAFGYVNASWTLKADLTAQYVCRLLNFMDAKGYAYAYPRHDPTIPRRDFMSLSSGYVQRASAILPKQGDRQPWRVHQNYLADLMAMRWSRLEDGVMTFGK
jgi:monooxygenase